MEAKDVTKEKKDDDENPVFVVKKNYNRVAPHVIVVDDFG